MIRVRSSTLLILLPALFFLFPLGAEAQLRASIGAGVAAPYGDFGDVFDTGFTLRGQAGLSLALVEAYGQAGWSRFSYGGGGDISVDDANIYHAGAGARVGLGIIWIGANAAYFFGDGEGGLGFFPEVGVGFWRLEVVADTRVDGDEKWAAARVGFRF